MIKPPIKIKHHNYIRPGLLFLILAILALLLLTSALLELRGTKRELLHIMDEQAGSLMESIQISGANAIIAYEEIEEQVTERLLNNAYFIDRLDQVEQLNQNKLAGFCRTNNIYRINIFDQNGDKLASSYDGFRVQEEEKQPPKQMLASILNGDTDELIIGLRQQ